MELLEMTGMTQSVAENTLTVIGYQSIGKQIKILVVDDRIENCSVLVNLLTPLGFEVHEASSGEEAITQACSLHPDLILMDLVMPIMNGFEATRQLRRLPEFKQIPIIAISASVFDYHHKASLDAGCNDFISKPLRTEELLEFLEKHLTLTWIYDQEEKKTFLPASTPQKDFALPTASSITMLLELTTIGDINGILEYLDKLEQDDGQLVPFARQIRQWAKSFKLETICEFLEKLGNA
jgi:CheY-like chemotaxis protein